MCTAVETDRIAELDRKLDFIVEEIANLKRLRTSAEDLAADLSLVGKSAMRDAVDAFGTADLRPQEIIGLLKTTMANASLFEALVQQLQSAVDFVRRRFQIPDKLCSARAHEIAFTAQRMIARKNIA